MVGAHIDMWCVKLAVDYANNRSYGATYVVKLFLITIKLIWCLKTLNQKTKDYRSTQLVNSQFVPYFFLILYDHLKNVKFPAACLKFIGRKDDRIYKFKRLLEIKRIQSISQFYNTYLSIYSNDSCAWCDCLWPCEWISIRVYSAENYKPFQ